MTKNQNGFGIIHILLLFLVFSFIGIAGWRIYDSRNNANLDNSAGNGTAPEMKEQKTTTIPSDWQWFTSTDGATKFAYPKSWGELVQKTDTNQGTYVTGSFIGRVSISPKQEFLTQVPQGYVDYTWYFWDKNADTLISARDINPPIQFDSSYNKPVRLGTALNITPMIKDSDSRAIYEVQGKGAMNCGVYHYFFSVNDKVVHIPATLCNRGGEWLPKDGQAYKDVVSDPLKDFYKYIQQPE